MKCKICENDKDNKEIILREMMFGLRDKFSYFQCSKCFCIKIENIPSNLEKYYPADYYPFIDVPIKKLSAFKKLQYNQVTGFKKSIVGSIATFRYKSGLYDWCKYLKLDNPNAKILDIGSGYGELLKKMYSLGFNDLTGADPFIEKELVINPSLRILKTDITQIPQRQYDAIMMHHSLEHMPNQQEVIQKLYELLADSGRALIRIPIVSKHLMKKYGVNVVSLDAPRHLFIHSLISIKKLIEESGFRIVRLDYDSSPFALIASEQYSKDISIYNDEKSYFGNKSQKIFTKTEINKFKKEIKKLNAEGNSDSISIFLEKA